ncbi:hypothetical protein Scep_024609 [Stephania cephalantha]|uniref:Uncharacterized protein n=1 Tax=Stephania cephalantha TaxID=152367 RepID=A0AAP0EXJ8_9MAGN
METRQPVQHGGISDANASDGEVNFDDELGRKEKKKEEKIRKDSTKQFEGSI